MGMMHLEGSFVDGSRCRRRWPSCKCGSQVRHILEVLQPDLGKIVDETRRHPPAEIDGDVAPDGASRAGQLLPCGQVVTRAHYCKDHRGCSDAQCGINDLLGRQTTS